MATRHGELGFHCEDILSKRSREGGCDRQQWRVQPGGPNTRRCHPYTAPENTGIVTCIKTGQKLFRCQVCQRAFARKLFLVNHERIHTGERPFKCSLCEKSYAWKFSLLCHEKVHKGERLYTCDICGKAFVLQSGLSQHRKSHW
ncbi:unnamed protein product [Ixodes pacificus]